MAIESSDGNAVNSTLCKDSMATSVDAKNSTHVKDSMTASVDNKMDKNDVLPNGAKQAQKKERVSFRDKVVGGSTTNFTESAAGLEGDRLGKITGKQGDSVRPSVTFTDETRAVYTQPFQEAVVIKVLDKNMSYMALFHKLKSVWRLRGGFKLLNVGKGYFLVKFEIAEEREKVLTGGPWMLNGHYIAVKPWTPTFRAGEESFGSTMVWIRIEDLPIWYYHEKLMTMVASTVGKPIKVDLTTKSTERGEYARACVQIDLAHPVVRGITVDGVDYEIQYESLQLICSHCDCYGHIDKECPKKHTSEVVPQQQQPDIITSTTIPMEKPFEFGKSNDMLKDDIQTHDIDAIRNEEAKTENWTEVKGKSKTKQGGQTGKPKNNFPYILNKGKVREASANPVKKKTGQVGTKIQALNSQANTPSRFDIRKRQRSSSAQSSPELRQISSVYASSSGTKNDEPRIEVVIKETPLVTQVSTKPQVLK